MAVAFVAAVTSSLATINGSGTAGGVTTFTVSVTPTVGELLVLKVGSGDAKTTVTGVSDNRGNTWTGRAGAVQTNYATAYVFTATAGSALATTITITVTNTGSSGSYPVGACVERYTGAVITGASATDTEWRTTTGTATFTPSTASSIWTWIDSDWAPATGATVSYSGATTPVATGTPYRDANANFFYARQAVTTAGTAQQYGMISPSGQKMAFAGVELLPAPPAGTYRRNLCTNPSAEVDVSGWADWIGGGPYTRVTGGATGAGSWAARWAPQAGYTFAYAWAPASPVGSVTPGLTYTASGYFKASKAVTAANQTVAISWFDAAGTHLSESYGTPVAMPTVNTFVRQSVTAAAPAGASYMRLGWAVTGNALTSDFYYGDGILYEQASSVGTYADGSTSSWLWEGTPHLSTAYTGTPPPAFTVYQGAASLTSSSSMTVGNPALSRTGAATLTSSSSVTAQAWGTWRADLSQANSNLAGFYDYSYNRQTNAGSDTLSGLAWPIPTEVAPGGRNGRALPFALPANGRRYEVVPKHADFGDKHSGWFGLAFYLETGFPVLSGSWQVIEQLRQASDVGSPGISLEVYGGSLHLNGGYGIDAVSPARLNYDQTLKTGLETGRWYNVVYQVIGFSTAESTTVVNVWIDGVKVLDAFTVPCPTVVPDTEGNVATYRKQGLYRDSGLAAATVHQAGQKFGYSYAEVDPSAAVTYQGAATTSSSSSLSASAVRTQLAAATLTSTSLTSANFYASIPIGGATTSAASFTTAAVTNRMTVGATTSSSSSLFIAPAVQAYAGAMVSQSSVVVDGSVKRTGSVTTSSSSMTYANGELLTAEGSTTSSGSSVSASVFLTMPVASTLTSSSVTAADVYVTMPVSGPIALTSSSSVSAGFPLVTLYGEALVVSQSVVTANGVRRTTTSAFLVSESSVRSTASGPEFLGSRDSVLYANPVLDMTAKTTLVSSSFIQVDSLLIRPASVTLVSQSSTAANLYAEVPGRATLTSSSHTTVSSLPVFKFGTALLVSSSSVDATSIVRLPNSFFTTSSSFVSAVAGQNTPVFVVPTGPAPIQLRIPTMRLMVAETVTGRITHELPFTDLSWSTELNKIGTLSATLLIEDALDSLRDQGAPDPRAALRGTLSGPRKLSYVLTYGENAIWAGPMQPSVDIEGAKQQVKVGGSEIGSILQNRVLLNWAVTSSSWGQVERDLVIRDANPAWAVYALVQNALDTQGGRPMRDLPITCMEPPSSRGEEAFSYLAYDLQSAWKAIQDITDRDDGPDVRFRPFVGWDEDGIGQLRYDLQIGDPYLKASGVPDDQGEAAWTWDDETSQVTRQNDGVDMTTALWVTGSGQDREKLITSADSSYLTDLGFPELERVDSSNTSETDQDKLAARARGLIAAHELPTETWTVDAPVDGEPQVGNFWPGDLARLEVFKHALIEPGVYKRRITAVGGDSGSRVKITCAVENTEMAEA